MWLPLLSCKTCKCEGRIITTQNLITITVDAQTEQRIQREIDLGHYREPAEVINRALDLLEAEEAWSEEEKAELDAHLAESIAQIDRGEGISGDHVRAKIAELRAAASAKCCPA